MVSVAIGISAGVDQGGGAGGAPEQEKFFQCGHADAFAAIIWDIQDVIGGEGDIRGQAFHDLVEGNAAISFLEPAASRR